MIILVGAENAAPKAQLMPFWNHSNEANNAKINHSAWQQILNRHLINSKHHSAM